MANLRADNLTGTGGRNAIDGSVFFDGQSSLTVADNSGYEFGTGDFTIECWINASDLTHKRHLPIIQKGNSATNNLYDWRLYFNNHGSGSSLLYFDIACSGVSIGTNSTSVFVEKDWNHVAVTRQSGAFKVFFNGILEDTDSTTANAIDDDYTEIKIGFNDLGSAGDSYLKGFISDLRIIKGTALYTASFTPPTEKLIGVDGTTLLCCQDSDDPTQEATGKSITGYGKLAAGQPIQPKVLPSVGVDEGVTFDGPIKINTQGVMYFPTGDSSQRGRGRGVLGGSYSHPTYNAQIDYLSIQSSGNSIKFGDLSVAKAEVASCSSTTRLLFAGGSVPGPLTGGAKQNTIEYVTIATTSNTTDFGDLTNSIRTLAGCSNGTRGIFGGGINDPARLNTIDYVTIASAGNAADFGDLTEQRRNICSHSSTTRGIFAGGLNPGPAYSDVIDYITIATAGNATDFGNLTVATYASTSCSNSTRGLIMGGNASPGAYTNTIQYITIASTGNAADFGDLLGAGRTEGAGIASPTRGLMIGGEDGSNRYNTIDYVTIASTGNAKDFGDYLITGRGQAGSSDCHGGLS